MDTNALKKFAQAARNLLIGQVAAKLDLVLADAAPARREHPQAVKDLENAIRKDGRTQVIEQVAYTWFNRFTALRFMDVNGYTQVRVVSPADNATRPEILSEAFAGNLPEGAPKSIPALLDGRTPSSDPQAEAYRQLLVHTCNQWHGPMPFLFEEIDDYTELLMPEDLLSQSSILAELRKVMTEDACQDVEIIGWLYQFYISEKKDQVFAGLKKNQKITAENIPAATQLFTPHWIVRYLVENSLGRLWLLNRPGSKLAERMDYYIAPESNEQEPETNFLKVGKPEEIKVCDPACGSGHMLTYAFDLLYAIYEEEGYEATEIPALILTHNLTGVEIDDRAGALAAFALMMKAAAKLGRRRFLRVETKPDICVLQNVAFTDAEMQDVAAVVGKDLFTEELRETLGQFEQAKNFGSLIVPKLRDPAETLRVVEARDFGGDLLLKEVQERVVVVLRMAEALSPKYHVVVANPPYMGSKGMSDATKSFLKMYFGDFSSDLFSSSLVRYVQLGLPFAKLGAVVPFVWMFIPTYEKFRDFLMANGSIQNLIQLEYNAFQPAMIPVCAFTYSKGQTDGTTGDYIRLVDFKGWETQAPRTLEAISDKNCRWRFKKDQSQFSRIPGTPISYWLPDSVFSAFEKGRSIVEISEKVTKGIFTGNNDRFVLTWSEVSWRGFSEGNWKKYSKAGGFRKYYGLSIFALRWKNSGHELRSFEGSGTGPAKYFGHPHICWSKLTSNKTSFRLDDPEVGFDDASPAIVSCDHLNSVVSYMNSHFVSTMLNVINPMLNYQSGDISKIVVPNIDLFATIAHGADRLVDLARSDWDAYETSWDFTSLPLLSPDHRGETLEATYARLRAYWRGMTDEMRALEEENNRIFIEAYGLQDELTPEVPLNEITLTCNPAYRYGVKGTEGERETRLRADTMAEFLSYAVGCMFGRYSLDAPGLILANQGETLADYLARIPEPSFTPDEDNVIPVLDENWFADDITERFRLFLRVTFGEAHFRENLRYIEDALGKDIRKYFTKDFYADHVKRYKKRPIYWMFSSPKGTFNAAVYMHRYRPDTVSILLNDYLRAFILKLEGERKRLEQLSDDPDASQGERTRAQKDAAKVAAQITELSDWERDVIFPLAQQKIEIDLDDGVKANYPKFGSALKAIKGLEASDE